MATTFRRVSSEITVVNPSGQILYTVPAATTSLGLSLLISYVGTGSTAFVNASVSGTDGEAFLVKEGVGNAENWVLTRFLKILRLEA